MCNSAPMLLYYVSVPVIFIILLLGFFIFLNNRRDVINRLFFLLALDLAVWMLFSTLSFSSMDIDNILIFDRVMIVGAFAPVIFFAIAYFFPKNVKKMPIKIIITIIISILPFLLLSATKYNIIGETAPPDCSPIPGILYWYIIPFVIFYFLWALIIFFKKYKKGEENTKKQIKSILFGFGVAIIWVLMTNVIPLFVRFSGYDLISLLAPVGVLFLVSSISYSIIKYQFLSIKLIAAQALTIAIWILIGSQYFFVQSTVNALLITLTLLLSIGFGIMLIKSVKEEVKRKEELQDMSDKLSGTNDRLRTLDNAKSEFISIASHQLRTPLTAIKGFVSLLLEDSYGKLEEKQKDVLRKVYVSNDRLVTLVEDLLNISRIESGRMEFKLTPWKVENICQEVMDTFIPKAKDLGLYLDYKKPETDLPEVMIDGIKVREVISNMVDNALKYTPKGGVTLRVEQDEVSLFVADKNADKEDEGLTGPVVRVIVSDTGIGVPVTELPYLFAKFSRGKDISRLNTGGTGLGLYVGRAIIENNGGRIWAESAGEGAGSRFIIEIPVNQSKELLERWG